MRIFFLKEEEKQTYSQADDNIAGVLIILFVAIRIINKKPIIPENLINFFKI